MTYQVTPVNSSSHDAHRLRFEGSHTNNGFPSSFRYFLISIWIENPDALDDADLFFENYSNSQPFEVQIGAGVGGINVQVNDGDTLQGQATFTGPTNAFDGSIPTLNVVISADTGTSTIQCAVNGVLLTPVTNTWTGTGTLANPTPANWFNMVLGTFHVGQTPWCVGDTYVHTPTTFFDLSVTANLRKFITADHEPVDPGFNGASVTGEQPLYLLKIPVGGTPGDFMVNFGTAGAVTNEFPEDLFTCDAFPFVAPGEVPTGYATPLTPAPLGYNDVRIVLDTAWTTDGVWCILQHYPMPITVLAIVPEVEVGDTPNG